ncbi:hypothetical protein ACHAWF_017876 [Thalassiosira exigua]
MVDYHMIVKDSDLKEVAHVSFSSETFDGCEYCGYHDFAKRTTLLEDALVNGTLTIEVRMRLGEPSRINTLAHQFIPSNPINKNILSMFMEEESSDVVFEVGPTNVTANTSPVNFHAHHLILHKSAPALAEMCGNGGNRENVAIASVKPEIFRHALHYAYGGKITDEDMQANAKEIIDFADRFGMVNLKLEAEESYVNSINIDVDNFMDNLLYADAKNCALLKEAVIDFLMENSENVLENVRFFPRE